MTNYERIKAMSVEEWVEALHIQIGCGLDSIPCGKVCGGKCECYTNVDCKQKIKAWLEREAQDGRFETMPSLR